MVFAEEFLGEALGAAARLRGAEQRGGKERGEVFEGERGRLAGGATEDGEDVGLGRGAGAVEPPRSGRVGGWRRKRARS